MKYDPTRAETSWGRNNGPAQSAFFARMFLDNCPPRVWDGVSCFLDAGCAEGDGTEVIRAARRLHCAWGVDILPGMVAVANRLFPTCSFMVQDLLEFMPPTYPVVYCSNVVEHYFEPYAVMRSVMGRAILHCAFVFPLREEDRITGHLCTLHRQHFPDMLHGMVLSHFAEVDCSKTGFWGGWQGIAVYSRNPAMLIAH